MATIVTMIGTCLLGHVRFDSLCVCLNDYQTDRHRGSREILVKIANTCKESGLDRDTDMDLNAVIKSLGARYFCPVDSLMFTSGKISTSLLLISISFVHLCLSVKVKLLIITEILYGRNGY